MATEDRRYEQEERAVAPHKEERRQISDQELTNLIRGLDNLHWNLQVQADILALGKRAVPALAGFLQGPPSQFPEGRVLAAEALGHIGGEAAFQGLLCALDPCRLEDLSPLLRLSEEDVQNAAARQLAQIGDRRAIPALLDALRAHRLAGAAEALVRIGLRCVPLVEQALVQGGVTVVGETVPLTVNARTAALATLDRLKGHVAC